MPSCAAGSKAAHQPLHRPNRMHTYRSEDPPSGTSDWGLFCPRQSSPGWLIWATDGRLLVQGQVRFSLMLWRRLRRQRPLLPLLNLGETAAVIEVKWRLRLLGPLPTRSLAPATVICTGYTNSERADISLAKVITPSSSATLLFNLVCLRISTINVMR